MILPTGLSTFPPLARGTALLAALGANDTLTELSLSSSLSDAILGGVEAAAALATSLRSNATLRTLAIHAASLGGPEGMCLVLGALGGSPLTALDISRQTLDLPACVALGESLARGLEA